MKISSNVLYNALSRYLFSSSKVHCPETSLIYYRHIARRLRLERIILWGCLLMEVLANHWQLHQDILSDSWNVVEEEQQEEEAGSAEYARHDRA